MPDLTREPRARTTVGGWYGSESLWRESAFRRFCEKSSFAVAIIGCDQTLLYVNSSLERLAGVEARLLVGRDLSGLYSTRTSILLRDEAFPAVAQGERWRGRIEFIRRRDGGTVPTLGFVFQLSTPCEAARVLVCISVERARKPQAELPTIDVSEVLDSSGSSVLVTSVDGLVQYANRRFLELTERAREEVLGKTHRSLCAPAFLASRDVEELRRATASGEGWRGEVERVRASGETFWELTSISPIKAHDGKTKQFVVIGEEETALRSERQLLEFQASHDLLTGLKNRFPFAQNLTEYANSLLSSPAFVALLLVDLDGFKKINDTMGHFAGDRLLRVQATRLKGTIRETDSVFRLGGDEFAILIKDINSESAVRRIAESILGAIRQPVEMEGRQIIVSASIGIALMPRDGQSGEDLTRKADLALYQAKSDGRDTFCLFSQDSGQEGPAVDRSMSEELMSPIENDQSSTSKPTLLHS